MTGELFKEAVTTKGVKFVSGEIAAHRSQTEPVLSDIIAEAVYPHRDELLEKFEKILVKERKQLTDQLSLIANRLITAGILAAFSIAFSIWYAAFIKLYS